MGANIPDFRLSVDGTELRASLPKRLLEQLGLDITGKVRPRLVSLSLSEKRGGEADQLDLVLEDTDGKLALPSRGAVLRLALGWAPGGEMPAGLVDKGSFKVDEVEWSGPPAIVTIRARSADLTSGFASRTERSWRDTTLGAVLSDIAAGNGLEARVAPALASVPIAVLAQRQESDKALLRRLGREHDALATVKDGSLLFLPIGSGESAGGAELPALLLTPRLGDHYRFRQVERSADAGVEARWHDQDSGERKTVRAGGKKGKARRLRKTFHSEAEAKRAARAAAKRGKRAELEFEQNLALGRADIFPGRPVTLSGYKRDAEAVSWIIGEVSHTLDARGFGTMLKLESRS